MSGRPQPMPYRRQKRLNQGLQPTESPATGNRLATPLPLRHLERLGDCRAHIEQALRAGPDHQVMAGWARRDGDRLWLHIGLVDRVRPIAAFDYHLGLAQTSLDISPLQRGCLADIRRKPVSLDRYGLRNAGVSFFSSSSFERTARASWR